jgi:hypothetical protein
MRNSPERVESTILKNSLMLSSMNISFEQKFTWCKAAEFHNLPETQSILQEIIKHLLKTVYSNNEIEVIELDTSHFIHCRKNSKWKKKITILIKR